MKKLYFLTITLFAFSLSGFAQSLYVVSVANFDFTPSNIEIYVGDTVQWVNSQGLHSVDGTLGTYPNNPESFGNGVAIAPWIYEFVFTIPGNYGYRCEQHPNAMIGTISVVDSTSSIDEANPDFTFAFFPNPVVNQLSWKWNKDNVPANCIMTMYNVEGKKIIEFSLNTNSSYDVSSMSKGMYTYTIQSDNRQIQSGKLLIQR